MQRLEVSGALRPIYGSLGIKWLRHGASLYAETTLPYFTYKCGKKKKEKKKSEKIILPMFKLYTELFNTHSSKFVCMYHVLEKVGVVIMQHDPYS